MGKTASICEQLTLWLQTIETLTNKKSWNIVSFDHLVFSSVFFFSVSVGLNGDSLGYLEKPTHHSQSPWVWGLDLMGVTPGSMQGPPKRWMFRWRFLLMRIPCCCLSFCFFGLFKDGQWSSWGIPPWVSFWLLLLLLLGSCEAFLLNSPSSAAIQCAGARELHPHGPRLRGLVLVYTKLRLTDQKTEKTPENLPIWQVLRNERILGDVTASRAPWSE